MSATNIAELLKRYNKNLYEQNDARENTNVSAEPPKLVSMSYIRPSDYMVDKYRNDPNFDAAMYQHAVSLGVGDDYLSLVAQNAGRRLDDKYYDGGDII